MEATRTPPTDHVATRTACPACGGGPMRVFFETERSPVLCNILCPTREEALAVPPGTIRLGFCPQCGMVYNVAFDAALMRYTGAYENSLQFSPQFQKYVDALARGLVERYGLRGRDVIEIGCGQGDFLSLLCELGDNRGIGFDPSYDPAKASTARSSRATILPELYSDAHVERPVDLLCCRHVLEHIPEPLVLLTGLRRTLGDRPDTVLFFEVPNGLYTLQRLGIWDIIYEHCSYFTAPSLTGLFRRAGFEPLRTHEVYDGQFLTIEAKPRPDGAAAKADPDEASAAAGGVARLAERFAAEYQAKSQAWRVRLEEIRRLGQRAVVWGAGSKGITFLNVMDAGHHVVPYAVDLNPRKHGRFVVGTGQKIVPPEFLREYRPDVVLVMNAIYAAEIAGKCRGLGLTCEVVNAA